MLIIILVIIGLSLLILLHEAGHFFAAKAFGLKIDEFGFGFPPRIFAIRRGETEYSFNWLPFGGFVKISGERGEFALSDDAQKPELKADVWDASSARSTDATNVLSVDRLFFAQPAWKKSVILLAGVAMNFILGILLIATALMIGTPKALVVSGIEPNSPASQAGIQANDIVKGVESGGVITNFNDSQSFIDFVNAHRGQAITLDLSRSTGELSIIVTPRVKTTPGQGAIGVALVDAGSPRENPIAAFRDAFVDSFALSIAILGSLWTLVSQLFFHASLAPGVVGPVGIFGVAEETGKIGLVYLLQFMGVIALNLGVVNLIPFPALDGGRFLVTMIEKVKGSPISQKFEMWVNGVGFSFLLLLMLVLTVRDVINLW